jgi:lantibiotic biosynthesis protein
MTWQPLLTGALKYQALEVASALLGTLPAPAADDQPSACLSTGAAGLAVSLAVAARTGRHDRAAGLAASHLDAAVEVLASRPFSLSLYSGFTGIGWAANLVDPLINGVAGDRCDDIDSALAGAAWHYPTLGPYDLIDGLAGVGTYALARWPGGAAADCLVGVLTQLARRARTDADGVYWWTANETLAGPRRQQYPSGGVDVGFAHGMAGLLPLLARSCSLAVCEPTVRPLLDGAVSWLLAHRLELASGPTMPSFIAPGAEPEPARSAWCYGDPGVAVALLLAAWEVDREDWLDAGTELALQAGRRLPGQTGVTSAGICHGAAGLAHLFMRMHQLTGNEELAAAATFWLGRTLEMCGQVAGRDAAGEAQDEGSRPGTGLLEGAAGIALVLLAACDPDEPAWDQMLLCGTGQPSSAQPSPAQPSPVSAR